MQTTIDATYRVVTPLFCAGADFAHPELRIASFKGVLRFWWRALAWPRYDGDLDRIQQREGCIFGSVNQGQSRVFMRLAATNGAPKICQNGWRLTVVADSDETVGTGARYLGYGVMEAFSSRKRGVEAGQLKRSCLQAPFEFTVQLRCHDICEADLRLLHNALIALGMLGGMGAKSRKGYGSMALRALFVNGQQCWSAPESTDDLKTAIEHLHCGRKTDGWPKYTAFSSRARHVLLTGEDMKPLQLLDRVGRELVRYRSWGRNGMVLNGIRSEKNFRDDHDLMTGGRAKKHPRRIAFGLPHNSRKVNVKPSEKGLDRRASPLFIHIHECGDTPAAVLSFLPAQFLPNGTNILVQNEKVRLVAEEELYRPIQDFLDRLLDWNRRKESFDEVIEVQS